MSVLSYAIIALVLLVCYAQHTHSWALFSKTSTGRTLQKSGGKAVAAIVTAGALMMPSAGGLLQPANAANDALEGATRAMMQKSSKDDAEDTRKFDELPDGAKKRRALGMCKDSDLRKGAGYKSESACTKAVLEGNYAIAFPTTSFSNSKLLQTSSAAPSKSTSSASSSGKSGASSGTSTAAPKREKVQDLSDLSSAAKKRRSLAACKKKDVQKYIGQSESKCTNTVLQGEYDAVIEAIEYGYN